MSLADICLFSLNASREFGAKVASHLGIPLSEHEEKDFEDGEHKSRPLVSVRGKEAFVIQSLYADDDQTINDKLCRLLFFLGALRDAAAAHVIAVIPYLCYARQDTRHQPNEPITTRYVANLLEAVGVDHVIALDVHNLAAFQNAFRCRTDHLDAKGIFADHVANLARGEDVVVLSPDIGGIKRAEKFREALSRRLKQAVASGFVEKHRTEQGISGRKLTADVKGKSIILFDDLISTGKTIARAAAACREAGAKRVYAAASHGLFAGEATTTLRIDAIDKIVVTNTVSPFRLAPDLVRERVTVLDAAKLFATAIERTHSGGSIWDLLGV